MARNNETRPDLDDVRRTFFGLIAQTTRNDGSVKTLVTATHAALALVTILPDKTIASITVKNSGTTSTIILTSMVHLRTMMAELQLRTKIRWTQQSDTTITGTWHGWMVTIKNGTHGTDTHMPDM
jgi:hypothetical protein